MLKKYVLQWKFWRLAKQKTARPVIFSANVKSVAFLPSCNVIRDLASGTSLPATDTVFNDGGQFDVLGRQVPFYYRQYYSAKEKLEDAYREMRGINISL